MPEPKRICENPMRKLFGAAMCHMLAVMMMKNLADPGRCVTCRSTRDPPRSCYCCQKKRNATFAMHTGFSHRKIMKIYVFI